MYNFLFFFKKVDENRCKFWLFQIIGLFQMPLNYVIHGLGFGEGT